MGSREPKWLCPRCPTSSIAACQDSWCGKRVLSCRRGEGRSLSSLCPSAAVCHRLSYCEKLSCCFLFPFSPFLPSFYLSESSQVSGSCHRSRAVLAHCCFPTWSFSPVLHASVWTSVPLESWEVLTFTRFLFLVDRAVLALLQPPGPFTEPAAALSQVSSPLPDTVDQVRFRHPL